MAKVLGTPIEAATIVAKSTHEEAEYWDEIHEAAANLTLLLVGIPVAAIILSSRLHKEDLVSAMLVGYRESQD